ncbi:MAG: hypothetical protein HXS54_19200 [Theionarchaea archaeon]|nr:hypothetical protein [Theionarchaea archaeon]
MSIWIRKKKTNKKAFLLVVGGLLVLTAGIISGEFFCIHDESCTSCSLDKRVSLTEIIRDNELCSTLTISQGEKVLFGGNVDSGLDAYSGAAPYIVFFSPQKGDTYEHGYGFVVIGWKWEEPWTTYEFFPCGMNEKGLAFSRIGLPKASMNSHPERPHSSFKSFCTKVMRECSSIDCVIEVAQSLDWGTSMSEQMHFADATGDAVVLSAGKDGELAVTRKDHQYLVSTNFNKANPENGEYPCWRYETAAEMLENRDDYTISYVESILNAIHKEGICVNTIITYIFDLRTGDGYVYYFNQVDDVVEFNIATELADMGEGNTRSYYTFTNLFSQETLNEAATALREYQKWKIALRMGIGSAAFLGFCFLMYRKVRIHKSESNI